MEIIVLLLIGLIALIWYDSMHAREHCLELAQRTCTEMGLKLLDETVALTSLGFRRNARGQLRFRRIYTFRALTVHLTIRHCTVILVGNQVESMLLDTRDPSP